MRCLAKVFQYHKFEPEVEFINSNSSSSNNSNSDNEDFIICHDKICWIVTYYCKKKSIFDCYIAMQLSGVCISVQRDVGNQSEPLLAESELPLQLKF